MFSHIKELFTRPSGYSIAKSVRLRSSASGNLSRTYGATGNQKLWTFSAWIKRGKLTDSSGGQTFFSGLDGTSAGNNRCRLTFEADDTLNFALTSMNTSETAGYRTTAVFRDPSAWYHVVVAIDTANATAGDRVKIYVNGTRYTTSGTTAALNANMPFGVSGVPTYIGEYYNPTSGTAYFDGYLTEINFIDGQALTPSSFGETDSITGVWKAKKYSGTYGTNGFYLNFSDNSSNTATTIGKDYSGNGNNWTPNNISVTAGATYDSMVDSPTVSAVSSNYAVLNPLYPSSTPVGGNLNVVGDSNSRTVAGTMSSSTGKWYAEGTFTSGYATNGWFFVWDTSTPYVAGNIPATTGQTGAYYKGTDGNITKSVTGTTTSIGTYSTWTNNDIIGMAFDADAGTISFYKNNTLQVTITDSAFIGRPLTFGIYYYAGNASMNFGQRPFTYTPPTGFVALNTYNLPVPTIKNGAGYMAATLYTGNGSTQTVNNSAGFYPDFNWIKSRNNAGSHVLVNSVVDGTKQLFSNLTDAEQTNTNITNGISSSGIALGNNSSGTGSTNQSAYTYVLWQWKANGSAVTNTAGSITSQVNAGATQGFSVVTYTGNSTSGATVGHGLGVAPKMVIVKARGTPNGIARSWFVYHASLGGTQFIYLDLTSAAQTGSTVWNNTNPSSTVFTLGNENSVNMSANNYVAYCFASVAGFSAFGSYTGNGSADGPFVFTGFRPRWIMMKCSSSAGLDWNIVDTSRNTYNVTNSRLWADLSNTEDSSDNVCDITSNGFKLRSTNTNTNSSGATFIYAAFAENPLKYSLAR